MPLADPFANLYSTLFNIVNIVLCATIWRPLVMHKRTGWLPFALSLHHSFQTPQTFSPDFPRGICVTFPCKTSHRSCNNIVMENLLLFLNFVNELEAKKSRFQFRTYSKFEEKFTKFEIMFHTPFRQALHNWN